MARKKGKPIHKIKGARLNPKAAAQFNEKIAENINNLEKEHNKLVGALRRKGII